MKLFLEKALNGQEYKKKPLTPEGSDRKYFRIITKEHSYILAHSPLSQQEKFLKRGKDFYDGGLNIPKVYFYQPNGLMGVKNEDKIRTTGYQNQKGFLLLEDLGDQSLEKEVLKNKTFPFFYYFQALDQIIKLSSWRDFGSQKRRKKHLSSLPSRTSFILPIFTTEQFFKEMLWTEKYLIGDFYQIDRSGQDCFSSRSRLQTSQKENQVRIKWEKDFQVKCRKEWQDICNTLSSFSFLPTHRDYHSRNIFIKNKKTYIIDFQDAGFFPRLYDVVSLLYDVYVYTKMTDKEREELLCYFVSHHPDLKSVEEIRWELAITTLQRLFKACGSFAGFFSLKKQDTHLKYIVPALKILKKELQDIKQYPSFLSLVDLLLDKTDQGGEIV